MPGKPVSRYPGRGRTRIPAALAGRISPLTSGRLMKRFLTTFLVAALCGTAIAEVRKWTSADDASKSFDGELVSVKGDSAVIKMKGGKSVTMPLAKLSQADQDFVAAQEKEKAASAAAAEAAAKLKDSPMAKALAGNTVILDGKRLKKHNILEGKAPTHYLLYWGASWCGPCRQAAPHLAEAYDESISKGKNIEVVHLSCDQDDAGMLSFVTDMKFNFPAVASAKWRKEKIFEPMAPSGIPNYKLVDAEGNVIAEGESAKSKAKELAAGSGEGTETASSK